MARLSGLQLRARRIVEGYVAGLHRSPYHGFSIEFAEHREYAPGDDLRYVDWKVFGRTDKYYLKQYEDETNLVVYLVLDASESMAYRGPGSALSKFEYAQCLAAALAWLVLRQQDAVGLVTVDQRLRDELPPSSQASHLKSLLQVLESTAPRSPTRLGPLLSQLGQSFRKRAIVVVISDLFDRCEELVTGLKWLRRQRHDPIVLHVLDRAEMEFPFDRPTLFRGLEGLPELDADPRSLRQAYLNEFHGFLTAIARTCREAEIDYRLIRTDQPLDVALASFLSARMAKVR